MNHTELAELLFPHIDKTPKYYETLYPERVLPEGAKVTRLGPSPTGFIHLGNLYGAFADERLAHRSGGVFFLRIEDTDEKREVEGAAETIISSLEYFGVTFDEGVTSEGERGIYGPYYQRARELIYQCYAKDLTARGLAYPCFCTEDQILLLREQQENSGENPGYYGSFARSEIWILSTLNGTLRKESPTCCAFALREIRAEAFKSLTASGDCCQCLRTSMMLCC